MLVVDDDPLMQALIARLLKADFDVQVVGAAAEALSLLDAGYVGDVLLTDFAMPRTDGVELVACLRERGHVLGTRALMFTGDVSSAKKRLDALGIEMHTLDKKADRRTLALVLAAEASEPRSERS